MKLSLVLFAGLVMSLSALSSNQFSSQTKVSPMTPEEIERDMERKFELRDSFVEKGTSFKNLRGRH